MNKLGKITVAEFGSIPDYPYLLGLLLEFHLGDGCAIGSGSKYTENVSKSCKWVPDGQDLNSHLQRESRSFAITAVVDKIADILTDAKANYVSELVGKPVEVTIEDGLFRDFRILTEVL